MQETWNPSRPSSSFPPVRRAPRRSSPSSKRSSPSPPPRPARWCSWSTTARLRAQAQLIEVAATELNCAYVLQQDGEGDSAAFNVGLSVAARARHGRLLRRLRAGPRVRRLARPPARPHGHRRRSPPPSSAAPSSSPRARSAMPATSSRASAAPGARGWRNVPEIVLDVARAAAVPGQLRAAVRPQRVDRAGRPLRRAARRGARGAGLLHPRQRGRRPVRARADGPRPRAASTPTAIPTRPAVTSSGCASSTARVNFYRWTPEVI